MNRQQRIVSGLIDIASGLVPVVSLGTLAPREWPWKYALYLASQQQAQQAQQQPQAAAGFVSTR